MPVLYLNWTLAGFLHRRPTEGMREGAYWDLAFWRYNHLRQNFTNDLAGTA